MFTDYLYSQVGKHLVTDTSIFTDLTNAQKKRAREIIINHETIAEKTPETVLASFLYAKTLKKLLEDPNSDLSRKIAGQPKLRETLRRAYMYTISKINDWYGYQFVAPMHTPFVVKDIDPIAGKKVKYLSEGTYGAVYSTDKNMAVKRMKYTDIDDFESTIRETAILRYLNHPNVIQLEAVQLKPPKFAMHLASGTIGSLDLNNIDTRKWVFYQLFRGLAYTHSKHVWHLDIKPDNTLVFPNKDIDGPIVKLADYGLASPYMTTGTKHNTNVITLWWRPPEILLGDNKYTESADVWSVGVMLLEAIAGRHIFPGQSERDEVKHIIGQLGSPDTTGWSEATNLPDWDTKFSGVSRRLSATRIPGTQFPFDKDEYDVVAATVEWPNKRKSALQMLKMPYFDSVRDKIEIQIPALPIIQEDCASQMITDQVPLAPYQGSFTKQAIVLDWLAQVALKFKLCNNTLLYAYELYYNIASKQVLKQEDQQLYGCVSLFIANQVYGLTPLDSSDFIYVTAHSITQKQLEKAYYAVLEMVDFDLIFPSVANFMDQYIIDDPIVNDAASLIIKTASLLYFNRDYVEQYTVAQLAQIAMEALNVKAKCMKDFTPLYTQSIHSYLLNASKKYKLFNIVTSHLVEAPATVAPAVAASAVAVETVDVAEAPASPEWRTVQRKHRRRKAKVDLP